MRKALIFLCVAASAGAQTVSGRWTGNIDAGVDLSGGGAIVVNRQPLVLDLQVRGDSVSGTADRGGRWRATVRGTFDGTRRQHVQERASHSRRDHERARQLRISELEYREERSDGDGDGGRDDGDPPRRAGQASHIVLPALGRHE